MLVGRKKNTRGRFLLSLSVSSLIAFAVTLYIEKGDSITRKGAFRQHFEQLEYKDTYHNMKVVSEKEAGGQHLLLYTYMNKDGEKQIGLALYRKMNVLPLYELYHFNDSPQLSVGTEFLHTNRFIVYGNRDDIGADYFTYRENIQFKRIKLEENDYFIHIEPYAGMLHVPQVNFYSIDGKIVGSTQAK
ncbi:MAG: hypothetical protein ACQEWI_00615 [Bacillota bacterium]